MKSNVQEGWSYATDDGRFKVYGTGNDCKVVTVETYAPGGGYGMSETPDQRVSVEVKAEDFRAIFTAANVRLPSPTRGGR